MAGMAITIDADEAGNIHPQDKRTVGHRLAPWALGDAYGQRVPAMARSEGDTVVVSASGITSPVAVRYAWVNFPDGCNLFNAAGLPAAQFRSDAPKVDL